MTVYSCGVNDLISESWSGNTLVFSFRKKLFKSHTYMLIFGPKQNQHKAWFLAQPGIKFLYVSKPAINTRYSATQKRNTLVIFEKDDTPKDVPKV